MRSNLPLTRRSLAAALLLAACSEGPASDAPPAASAAGSTAWFTHRDAAGTFEARFPLPPTVQELTPPRKSPEASQLQISNAQLAEDKRLFVATKLLLSEVKNYDCESGMKGMIDSSLTGLGCTADKNEAHAMQGLPGKEVTVTCQKSPMRGVLRVACDAKMIAEQNITAYSLLVLYDNEIWNADEAALFLDSFKLLAPP